MPFKSSHLQVTTKKKWFLITAGLGLVYGIVMEFVQKNYIPNRSYDVWDIVADGIGCIIAVVVSNKFFVNDRAKK